MNITVVDYGLGNLDSVECALRFVGATPFITSDPEKVAAADKLILPGVGAFKEGMARLTSAGLDLAVRNFAASGKPLLGICLGMQLLLDSSTEQGNSTGLGLVPGKVVRLEGEGFARGGCKVPHTGWNRVQQQPANAWEGTVLAGVTEGSFFYFVHSYYAIVKDPVDSIAVTEYGGIEFCSMLKKGQLYGCQFHPEKSASAGLKMLENFHALMP